MDGNEKALNEFVGTLAAIQGKLDALQTHMANHMGTSPEEVNWGDVGSAKHILHMLNEVGDFAGIE